jgi:hypothetical protein
VPCELSNTRLGIGAETACTQTGHLGFLIRQRRTSSQPFGPGHCQGFTLDRGTAHSRVLSFTHLGNRFIRLIERAVERTDTWILAQDESAFTGPEEQPGLSTDRAERGLILFLLASKAYSPNSACGSCPGWPPALPGSVGSRRSGCSRRSRPETCRCLSRFSWFGIEGPDQWVFETAVVLRALVLVACLVACVRGPSPGLERSVNYSNSAGLVPT